MLQGLGTNGDGIESSGAMIKRGPLGSPLDSADYSTGDGICATDIKERATWFKS